MKTILEVEQWRAQCAEFVETNLLGDDPICQLFVRYVEPDRRPQHVKDYFDLFAFREGNEIVLWLGPDPDLIIPVVISRAGPETNEQGELTAFGAEAVTRAKTRCIIWIRRIPLAPGSTPTAAPWSIATAGR